MPNPIQNAASTTAAIAGVVIDVDLELGKFFRKLQSLPNRSLTAGIASGVGGAISGAASSFISQAGGAGMAGANLYLNASGIAPYAQKYGIGILANSGIPGLEQFGQSLQASNAGLGAHGTALDQLKAVSGQFAGQKTPLSDDMVRTLGRGLVGRANAVQDDAIRVDRVMQGDQRAGLDNMERQFRKRGLEDGVRPLGELPGEALDSYKQFFERLKKLGWQGLFR